MKNRKRAVFVDRDGTLNEMVYDETHGTLDSPRVPEQVRLRPGAASFIKNVKAKGFLVIVATNQPGIAKGTLSPAGLDAVNNKLLSLLQSEGADWDDLFFCPHHPASGVGCNPAYVLACSCRKPHPGLLIEGSTKYGIDLSESWMVGDGINDIQAGKRAGCRTCLVTSLKIEQVELFFSLEDAYPDLVVTSLGVAAESVY